MDPGQLEPIFQKTLRNTDITDRLALPVSLIDHVWGPNDPLEKDFRVVDLFGASWDLKGHMRFDPRGHQKPEVYGSEWRRFVKTKHPRVGDVLVFHRHPNPVSSQAVFVLSIKREITLMGATFPGHI